LFRWVGMLLPRITRSLLQNRVGVHTASSTHQESRMTGVVGMIGNMCQAVSIHHVTKLINESSLTLVLNFNYRFALNQFYSLVQKYISNPALINQKKYGWILSTLPTLVTTPIPTATPGPTLTIAPRPRPRSTSTPVRTPTVHFR